MLRAGVAAAAVVMLVCAACTQHVDHVQAAAPHTATVKPSEPSEPPSRMVETSDTDFLVRHFKTASAEMPYRLFVPADYAGDRLYPLVVWLHGSGGIGKDNLLQIQGDQVPGTHLWIKPEHQAAHPAFVLVPQSAKDWSMHDTPTDLHDDPRTVMSVIDEVTREFTIDPARIYLLGQSMGGAAAWNLISNVRDRFAATILVCPVLPDITRAAQVAGDPFWLFEGQKDANAAQGRAPVSALKKAGGTPRFTEYAGMGHDIWTRVFAEPDIVPWLYAQKRQ